MTACSLTEGHPVLSQVDKAMAAARGLLDIAGVVGVGLGERESGACVVVFVAARTPRLVAALPKEILGVPVAVRETRLLP
jgi:hypothetical protein